MNKKIMRVLVIALGIAVLFFGLKQKSNNINKPAIVGQTYTLGAILPMTGDAGVYGEALSKAILLAKDEINNSDGNNKINFTIEDGKCNGKDAANAAQKLVAVDKVQAILGGFCSGETLATVPIAEAGKVVVLSAGSTSPKLSGISPYFFRDIASDASQGSLDAAIANKKNYKSIAVLQEQTDYALGIYNVFMEKFSGKTVKEEYSTSATDFRSQLIKLKSENPEAVFLITQTSASAERILKQLKDLGWKPQIFIDETVIGDAKAVAANKEILEGAIGAEPGVDKSNLKFQHFLQAYKAKYGQDMPYPSFGQNIYDAVYLLKDGITRVGYNGEKLAAWSRTVKDWQGASGDISITPEGDRLSGYVSEIVKDGKIQIYQQ